MDEHREVYEFDWIEYTVFVVMLCLSAFIGFYYGFIKGGQDTVSGYLFGGKQMSLFPIAMSLVSSFISGITLLGVPAEVYVYGTQYMVGSTALIGVGIVTAYVSIPIFYKLQLLSLYEYFELRFNTKVRLVVSFLFIFSHLCYIPVVIYTPALAINQISGINVHIITPFLCLICIFYTTVGGLKAVVWSDTLQGGLMIFSIIAVAWTGAWKMGGFGNVFKAAYEGGRLQAFNFDPDPTLRLSFWSASFGIWVFWASNTSFHPASIQRFISLPTMKMAKWSVLYTVLGTLFFLNLSGLIGLVIYAYYKDCDPYTTKVINRPDQILPLFVVEVAGKIRGLPGLFLSGVVCAALSTMSTGLNTMAGTVYEDFIEPYLKVKITEKKASQIMKLLVVVMGSVCVLLILVIEKLGAILEISVRFSGMTSGTTLGLFLLGAFFPTSNAKGAAWGALVSLVVMTWILVGSNLAMANGLISNPVLPTSIEGCPFNVTDVVPVAQAATDAYVFPLYKVSIFYYSFIGCTVVMVVGLVVSYLTGPNKIGDVNRKLLSPLIYGLLPKEVENDYKGVPLKPVNGYD
ncbi:sodium-coupled monocarboxylate transporter 1-like [Cimex lectularius]|uniref:Sodium/solute symporter n=1 Tax=Cimex lectularius TaxID=79782 RepID=A0A8I6SJU5_CIMLE|nr:sodium-coupled monocarboxylate transporter 1-like [Cimex lectularius]XP_024083168.1 sodium-coupled monocarboxylate transporter 1-like [Cimex lectularius]